MTAEGLDFVVDRRDLRRTAFLPGRHSDETSLASGELLLRVDRFAFTANNITYGAVGEMIGYWRFFPAPEPWGRIPVWGFADVVRSRHEAVPSGERIYGYLPMSTHLVLQPDHVSGTSLVDAAAHRAGLPAVYNSYTRVAADPAYDPAREAETSLFRPLFTTSFLLADFLAEERFFGARSVVLSSASSKTALGLAFLLARSAHVVGLTSAAHAPFVARTGYFATVLGYEDIGILSRESPTVFVDFAGNAAVVGAVHRRLGSQLAYSARVGVTHWEKMTPPDALPGPAPVFFFAPDRARQRLQDWGAAAFQTRVADAMRGFLASTLAWLRVVEGRGRAAVESVYRATLEGDADPAQGHVLSL